MQLLFVPVRYKLGQSLADDALSIFIQTHTDNIASVEQFIGRNRCDESIMHLFLSIDRLKQLMMILKTVIITD